MIFYGKRFNYERVLLRTAPFILLSLSLFLSLSLSASYYLFYSFHLYFTIYIPLISYIGYINILVVLITYDKSSFNNKKLFHNNSYNLNIPPPTK
jgi:hypothetical protein